MRPGATKETVRRENENLFFDVLCLTLCTPIMLHHAPVSAPQ